MSDLRNAASPSRSVRVVTFALTGYQSWRRGRPSPCRFYPSCSAYTAEAVAAHGAAKGLVLGGRRLLRCRPGGPSGIDLVPSPGHSAPPASSK